MYKLVTVYTNKNKTITQEFYIVNTETRTVHTVWKNYTEATAVMKKLVVLAKVMAA